MRFLVLLVALVLGACGREERRAPDVIERARTRIEAKDVTTPEEVEPEVSAAPDEVVVVAEVVEAPEVSPDAVTREVCEKACANAAKVTLAELPADSASAMRAEIETVMRDKCPTECLERANIEAVRCIGNAKTALELAGCPR